MLVSLLLTVSLVAAYPARVADLNNDSTKILPAAKREPYLLEDPDEPIITGPTNSSAHTVAKTGFHPMNDRREQDAEFPDTFTDDGLHPREEDDGLYSPE